MLYCAARCPVCAGGPVGFCRQRDGVHLGLLCSVCDSFYDAPQRIEASRAQFVPNPALAQGGRPTWAGQGEVELRGWLADVAGEWSDGP